MIRARFYTAAEDCRPVEWPIPYPYWQSGFSEDATIIVAFVDNEEQLLEFWPEAYDIESEEVDRVEFTERFPKPDWYEVAT